MINPPMSSLLEKVDSRYTLAILTAKRARLLTDGAPKLTDYDSNKDVTIALHEIKEGKVSYRRIEKQLVSTENLIEASLDSTDDSV
ncbi:MAG: DNA-directed RNA polymerase subunit omega [Clostridiaceae bacterium]|nr:DNA-directed RNA polymerase subunit omega [Clostridiaceae bacterium]